MNKTRIILSVLLVVAYIYLGELYRLWGYEDKIKLHNVAAPIYTQWYITMLSIFIRPLILIFVVLWNRSDKNFLLWFCSIVGIFCLQDLIWLLWNFQNPHSYYWTIFYSVAFIDTLFFAKYWRGVFTGQNKKS